MEYRRKRKGRKLNRSIEHRVVANNSGVVSSYLPNIADLISYGHITVGVLHPTGCIAIATDGEHTYSAAQKKPWPSCSPASTRPSTKLLSKTSTLTKSTRPPDISKTCKCPLPFLRGHLE